MALIREKDPRWLVEERPDGKNVNNWHWQSKNVAHTAFALLAEKFRGKTFLEDQVSAFFFEMINPSGSVELNVRKGKLVCFTDLNFQLNWLAAESGISAASGIITITNLVADEQPDDLELSMTYTEGCSPLPSEFERRLKTGARQKIKETLDCTISELKAKAMEEVEAARALPSHQIPANSQSLEVVVADTASPPTSWLFVSAAVAVVAAISYFGFKHSHP